MSGHSKWHNIKLRKGKQDAQRSNLFTKLAREIIIAARDGGSNPDANMRLRLAMQKSREKGMPQDTIKRAVQRGSGELEGAQYEDVVWEGYGPGGVAILVSCFTDNRNRTVAELRVIFSRNGGSLGESGSVAWIFDQKGMITIEKSEIDEDRLMEIVLDAGAEDIDSEGDIFEITTAPSDFPQVRQALEDAKVKVVEAELAMIPKNTVSIQGKEASQVLRMMDQFDELDDVQQAYANFDIPEEELEALAG